MTNEKEIKCPIKFLAVPIQGLIRAHFHGTNAIGCSNFRAQIITLILRKTVFVPFKVFLDK